MSTEWLPDPADDVLAALETDLRRAGVVADRMPACKLIYLAVTSRVFARPVSVLIKGPTSAGKSWVTDRVLDLCPPSAYYRLSGSSPKAVVFDPEPLQHRMLVLSESESIKGEAGAYMIRTLLSEGVIRHSTVSKVDGRLSSQVVEKQGPTGLVATTASIAHHVENESRYLSVPIADSPESQRAVLDEWGAEAAGEPREKVDVSGWHAFGRSLETGERRVVIPFMPAVAELITGAALRIQRDFIQVISLIKAHALLHRHSRTRDDDGRIVATLCDYAQVRELVESIIAVGLGASVRAQVRETVEAIEHLAPQHQRGVPQRALAVRLRIGKAATHRRVEEAIEAEVVVDEDPNPGRPSRLKVIDDALPDDGVVLPLPGDVQRLHEAGLGGDES